MSNRYRSILSLGSSTPPFSNVNSFSFDGVDDYFIVPDTSGLSFGNGTTDSPFSISAWVKIGQTTAQGIVTKYGSSSRTREYTFYTTGGKLRLLLWGNGTNNFATGTTTFTTDTWYHVACTYDGRGGSTAYNGITLYINGVAESVTTSGGSYTAMSNTSQPLYIGKENAKLIDGNIDETAIFTTELSASDISAIYNNGEPQSLDAYSPFVWFRMGDNATWNGFAWTMTSVGTDTRTARSANMVEANRTTDVPPNPFVNTLSTLYDGVDDRINFASTITFSGEFSFNWWMKPQGYATNSKAYIWGRWGSNTDFLKLNNNSQLVLQIGGISRTLNRILGGDTIDLNVWSKICLTRDSSNNIKAYVNGNLFASSSASTTLRVQTIGRIINNGFGFLGAIDEVSFFNRELNSSEITTIYNGGLPSDVSSISGIIHWYRCGDGDTATTITDNIGSNNATMINFTTFSTDVPT